MNEDPIKFRFAGIQVISKTVLEMRPENPAKPTNFVIKVETRVVAPSKVVVPYVFVQITNGDDPYYLADFTIACYFELVDFDTVIKLLENGTYEVPSQLESIIRPVSVSTARGVIYSELRGTYLQNTIMPVVFMHDFTIEPYPDTSVGAVNN